MGACCCSFGEQICNEEFEYHGIAVTESQYEGLPFDVVLPNDLIRHCVNFLLPSINDTSEIHIPISDHDGVSSLILVNQKMNEICTDKRYKNIPNRWICLNSEVNTNTVEWKESIGKCFNRYGNMNKLMLKCIHHQLRDAIGSVPHMWNHIQEIQFDKTPWE